MYLIAEAAFAKEIGYELEVLKFTHQGVEIKQYLSPQTAKMNQDDLTIGLSFALDACIALADCSRRSCQDWHSHAR